MGAYLSEPVTEKFSTNETGSRISYGASSMQGWRMSQEDAHNTILNYDRDTSFFAVYDGHGGAEVAKYCAMKLPDFVKTLSCYKEGNLEEALREGFLQFDASLVTTTGLSELKALAGTSSDDSGEATPEEGEADMLHAEATMPIEDLLARYSGRVKEAVCEEKDGGKKGGVTGGSDADDKPESQQAGEKIVNGECSQEEQSEQKVDDEGKAGSSCDTAEAGGSASSSGSAGAGDEEPQSGRRSRRNWKPYMALVADQDASSDSSESGEDEEEGCGGWNERLKRRLSQLNTLPTGDTETAGYDSGCTAVVGLVRGRHLVVANAGDSRCVVCRSGQALDMSLDHKPEDAAEYNRIRNAGGRVTKEGRVNGGLNLSRAIDTTGDGTGCDNMTCIIVQFHQDKDDDHVANGNRGQKRSLPADGEPSEGTKESDKDTVEETPSKRCRVDDSATAGDVEATPNGAKATEVTDV
ncbi:hypothetical protein HPB52_004051 [Rhipicephalus sanguineus]|uniref:protein-serine/threonine phosphatase n=1 Tax=Rhipicephalus sanguineus TaxID=34632 RepID=A0A9D4QCX2_RHISA|nr:hypothetical protein HPB52_004051 [Rhipicephalus sanguineus]